MSIAARRSHRGDSYQERIAIYWITCLLSNNKLSWVKSETMDSVDDVVVYQKDGSYLYIQAKKNQKDCREWSIPDFKSELLKACDQIEKCPSDKVIFYSRTPFGDIGKYLEAAHCDFESYDSFVNNAPQTRKKTLSELAKAIDRDEKTTFELFLKVEIGGHHSFEEWEQLILDKLNPIVHNPHLAFTVLESLVRENQSGLKRIFKITREDVISAFKDKGLPLSPFKTEKEIIESFKQASCIGRNDISREIGGTKIERKEAALILEFLEKDVRKIIVTGSPGSGKSWVLLELADILESKPEFGLLYIRGDRFDDIETDESFRQRLNLESDIVSLAARLSSFRKTVAILDSLDALALARDQKALRIFLGLIDRLTSVNDISIVAACRTFDLNYDPLLRDRKWDENIEVSNLDFEQNVAPILEKWKVNPQNIPQEQRILLTIPRNLKMFERFADKVPIESLTSSYKFSDIFIDEIVVRNRNLGKNALDALKDMTVKLTEKRQLQLFKDKFIGDDQMSKLLESEGVIRNISDIKIEFSHQTLIDALSTRNAIANDQTLESFILSHPPLPFIRPLVRSFLFYLRTYDSKRFPIQIIKVFDNPEITYHIKRLIAESLSEITPFPEDVKFFERILREHKDLFRRFLHIMKMEKWFDFFEKNIFITIMSDQSFKDLKLFFMSNCEKWMNTRPDQIIKYWNDIIKEHSDIAIQIILQIEKFEHWETEGVYELLASLAKKAKGHWTDFIIKALSKYIEALNKGDELLWKIITSNIKEDTKIDAFSLDSQQNGLICDKRDFHKEDFLKIRMCQSDYLISTAIHAIERWSEKLYDFKQTYRDNFLRFTSWQRIHSKADRHSYGPFHFLLDAILSAIQERSKNNDKWWQENKKVLSNCKEAAIIYFLIQGYRANIEDNISDISSFLIEQKNLLYSQFNDEIGELINEAFPYLSQQSQDDLQHLILNLKSPYDSEKDEIPRWLIELQYKYLYNIPIFLRFIETNQFIEKYRHKFGEYPQPPYVYSWGGIGSPVSSEQILSFSDDTIIKLFKHYSQSHRDWYEREHSIGGSESVSSAFREACTSDPARFILFFDIILSEGIDNAYAESIMKGIAQHISYRFGNYRPTKEWKPKEPMPDGIFLAQTILNWLRLHEFLWKNPHETARVIKACSWVIEEPSDVEWLIFCLFRLSKNHNSNKIEQHLLSYDKKEISAEDLSHIALNSIRGIAAESAILLASRLLANDKELPELLFPLGNGFLLTLKKSMI